MIARLLLAALLAVAACLPLGSAAAEDRAVTTVGRLRIGERTTLTLEIETPAGATVEIDTAAESWAGVEVVSIGQVVTTPSGAGKLHRIPLVVAPFIPGDIAVRPAVIIVRGSAVEPRTLGVIAWTVVSSLGEGEPLRISPLAEPASIPGAESPLLRPAIGAGAAAVMALLVGIAYWLWRWMRSRRVDLAEEVPPFARPGLEGVDGVIDSDPVSAYRTMGYTVRTVIGRQYGFPAQSLTTRELRTRMEGYGVERFQARLVSGLLEECDEVVYAGYRPAPERRRADLTMAREIVEGAS
jgi:hypothetical protein